MNTTNHQRIHMQLSFHTTTQDAISHIQQHHTKHEHMLTGLDLDTRSQKGKLHALNSLHALLHASDTTNHQTESKANHEDKK
jgi:hypothetical protein